MAQGVPIRPGSVPGSGRHRSLGRIETGLAERVRRAEWPVERSQKVVVIAGLAEHRDRSTGEHILRVARLTHEIAHQLAVRGEHGAELDDGFLHHVGTASILHDVGKVGFRTAFCSRPDP